MSVKHLARPAVGGSETDQQLLNVGFRTCDKRSVRDGLDDDLRIDGQARCGLARCLGCARRAPDGLRVRPEARHQTCGFGFIQRRDQKIEAVDSARTGLSPSGRHDLLKASPRAEEDRSIAALVIQNAPRPSFLASGLSAIKSVLLLRRSMPPASAPPAGLEVPLLSHSRAAQVLGQARTSSNCRSRARIAASSTGSAWSQPQTCRTPWVTRSRSSSAGDQRTSSV